MTTILLPVDGSLLAEAAVPVARWLAQGLNAGIVLVTVGTDPETAEQASDESADLERTLARAASELSPVTVRRRIETNNDPVAGILEAAREEHADLIVMSTHGRTGWSELVQGSVAAEVVRAGIDPVTLVHAREGGWVVLARSRGAMPGTSFSADEAPLTPPDLCYCRDRVRSSMRNNRVAHGERPRC
jgi:nucleotide-binding universal stress UspA family protein